ncbi:MAG TPA: saccharopine dehydrogenase C-terminal domain-containing protein, partial [Saprospiraceae bacterium]|nr:saccharopine dehydrogenase C-terminal domain-containing protein [Saprospiraceae bacterium]
MKKILILGGGLVGTPMALDLAKDAKWDITVVDRSELVLNRLRQSEGVHVKQADMSDQNVLREIVNSFDLVINALPGYLGFRAVENLIDCGKNVVDIAFSPEDLSPLSQRAKEKGLTVIVDFGVAPGLSHMIAGMLDQRFDVIEKLRIFVGGIPKRRTKPFEYFAVFSPIDVIEEYTRPARLVQNGQIVFKDALSDIEELEFEGIGTLEAFNSDGLRSLVHSVKAKDMAEKTLRYPGHAQLMKLFRETGFFSQEAIEINGNSVRPMDVTSKLLFPLWKMKPEDRDVTVMKITAEGLIEGKMKKYAFELYDEFDVSTGIHSMARTTGYTATLGARLILNDIFSTKGLFYPESVVQQNDVL